MCFRRTFARHDNVSSLMKSQAFPIFHRIPKSAILWLPHAYERSDKGFNNAFACGTRIQPCLAPIWRASPISSLYSNVTSPNLPRLRRYHTTSDSRVASHTTMTDQTYITGALQTTTIGSTCAIATQPSVTFRQRLSTICHGRKSG
jgi:hypothetical protein